MAKFITKRGPLDTVFDLPVKRVDTGEEMRACDVSPSHVVWIDVAVKNGKVTRVVPTRARRDVADYEAWLRDKERLERTVKPILTARDKTVVPLAPTTPVGNPRHTRNLIVMQRGAGAFVVVLDSKSDSADMESFIVANIVETAAMYLEAEGLTVSASGQSIICNDDVAVRRVLGRVAARLGCALLYQLGDRR